MDWKDQTAVEPEVPGPSDYRSQRHVQPEQSGLPVSDELKDSSDAEVGLVDDRTKKNSSPDTEDEGVSENTPKVDAMETDVETEADEKKTEGDKMEFEEAIEMPGEFPLSAVHASAPEAPGLLVQEEVSEESDEELAEDKQLRFKRSRYWLD